MSDRFVSVLVLLATTGLLMAGCAESHLTEADARVARDGGAASVDGGSDAAGPPLDASFDAGDLPPYRGTLLALLAFEARGAAIIREHDLTGAILRTWDVPLSDLHPRRGSLEVTPEGSVTVALADDEQSQLFSFDLEGEIWAPAMTWPARLDRLTAEGLIVLEPSFDASAGGVAFRLVGLDGSVREAWLPPGAVREAPLDVAVPTARGAIHLYTSGIPGYRAVSIFSPGTLAFERAVELGNEIMPFWHTRVARDESLYFWHAHRHAFVRTDFEEVLSEHFTGPDIGRVLDVHRSGEVLVQNERTERFSILRPTLESRVTDIELAGDFEDIWAARFADPN